MKTHIEILLDRSGSMETCKAAMEEACNGFLRNQLSYPGECTVSLRQFDTEYETIYEFRDIRHAPLINLQPRGGTALTDALCRSIDSLGQSLAHMEESVRPQKVIFVVITDGQENSSKEFRKHQAKERIQHQTEKYKWTFVYLGANQDAFAESAMYGFHSSNTMNYDQSEKGLKYMTEVMGVNLAAARHADPDQVRGFFEGSKTNE